MKKENTKKPIHFMIDIETLGTCPYSVIIRVSAVKFDITEVNSQMMYDDNDVFDGHINLFDSIGKHGLIIEKDTLKWWQGKDNVDTFGKLLTVCSTNNFDNLSMCHALADFLCYYIDDEKTPFFVWGNSARFDLGLLANVYERCNVPLPWKWWNERCMRTYASIIPDIRKNHKFIGQPHNSVDDAKNQILIAQKIYQRLNPQIIDEFKPVYE